MLLIDGCGDTVVIGHVSSDGLDDALMEASRCVSKILLSRARKLPAGCSGPSGLLRQLQTTTCERG